MERDTCSDKSFTYLCSSKERANSDVMCANCFKINPAVEFLNQCENCLHFNRRKGSEDDDSHFRPAAHSFHVESEQGCGRFLVATRDVLPGELILQERPIIVGPMMMECVSSLYPTCLGCCRVTNTSYSCSKCKWPVCGEACEKMKAHSEFECKIFRKAKIPSLPHPQRYQMIQILRCCLLREISPKHFAQLLSLESHVENRKDILYHKPGKEKECNFIEQAFRFLVEMCKLKYDYDLVDYIIGVCWVNSFGADALLGYKKRRCSLIFHKLSMLNHDCIPNTSLVIHEKREGDRDKGSVRGGIGNIWGELRASVLIRAGERISQQYVNVVQGTTERRCALFDNWYFSCTCARCRDPTENQTFFSAVKCQQCSSGYLLPLNPLDISSVWKCQLLPLRNEDSSICDNYLCAETVKFLVKEFSNTVLTFKDDIKSLEELIEQNSGRVFHPQHFLIQDIKYQIVEEFINISAYKLRERCSDDDSPSLLRNGVDFHQLASRCVQYSRDLLTVADRISPGESTYRGVLIYFLCYSMYCLIHNKKESVGEAEECQGKEFERLVSQGRIILLKKAEGSPYISMAERLNTFLAN